MRVRRLRDWPLRVKVVLALLVASTVPMAIALPIAFHFGADQRREVLEGQGGAIAVQIAGQIDEFLRSYWRMGGLFARGRTIVAYYTLPPDKQKEVEERLRPSLTQRVEEDKFLLAMALLDASGHVVMSSDDDMDKQLKRLPSVRQALETGSDVVGEVQLVSLFPRRPAEAVIPIIEPVKDEKDHRV